MVALLWSIVIAALMVALLYFIDHNPLQRKR
jgi:hypothetical protein